MARGSMCLAQMALACLSAVPDPTSAVVLCVQEGEAIIVHPHLNVTFREATGTIARLNLLGPSCNFSYVPLDGDFGANRTLPGFSALGDVAMRLRPAHLQTITLSPLPYLEAFPLYTTLSSINGDPGQQLIKARQYYGATVFRQGSNLRTPICSSDCGCLESSRPCSRYCE